MTADILASIGNTPLVRLNRVAAGLPVQVYGSASSSTPAAASRTGSPPPSSPTPRPGASCGRG